ncbi:MAG TPA: hypothetical protein PLW44_08320 [Chitinophagales bacterium]|nr:hypothetical protein [Chitinophagales bacterium]
MEPIQCKVEGVFNLTGKSWVVLVECITEGYQFSYNKPYLLGGYAGNMFAPMAAKDKQGNDRLHLYCFTLNNQEDRYKFKEGDVVTLTNTTPL